MGLKESVLGERRKVCMGWASEWLADVPREFEWHDVKGVVQKKRRWALHDMHPLRGSTLRFLRVWRRRKRDCGA